MTLCEYLEVIWGVESVAQLSPCEAGLILDNVHDESDDYCLDVEAWELYAQLHNLPQNMTPNQYRKSTHYEKHKR